MKTIQKVWLLLAVLTLTHVSCTKGTDAETTVPAPSSTIVQFNNKPINIGIISGSLGLLEAQTSNLSFCSPLSVDLCAGQTINSGSVDVKTGSDKKIYITYSSTGGWAFKELQLYLGDAANVPMTKTGNPQIGHFPLKVAFKSPFTVTEYTFVVNQNDLPANFTVAAHASVVKVVKGVTTGQETAWGDGCDGKKINNGNKGSWATMFDYTSTACLSAPITLPNPIDQVVVIPDESNGLCSLPFMTWYDSVSVTEWYDVNGDNPGVVDVGPFSYTEAEGRQLYKTGSCDPATMPDSKYGFMQATSLKLSYTDYAMSPSLKEAVTTIESYLGKVGKLTPNNMPTGDIQVRNAAARIELWINTHNCPGRL